MRVLGGVAAAKGGKGTGSRGGGGLAPASPSELLARESAVSAGASASTAKRCVAAGASMWLLARLRRASVGCGCSTKDAMAAVPSRPRAARRGRGVGRHGACEAVRGWGSTREARASSLGGGSCGCACGGGSGRCGKGGEGTVGGKHE